jgi:capsid protein
MRAHGFKTEMLVEMVNAGLATASTECMVAGKHRIEVARVRITEAGRRELG